VLRGSYLFLIALVLVLLPAHALAAPLDKPANKKIDEAVNQHYLATSFNKAESILLGTLKACGDRCDKTTLARAWMYIGIVRGSGKNNMAGAKLAFAYAVYLDPKIKLDAALATPETKAAFRQAKASGGSPPPDKTPPPSEDKTPEPTPTTPAPLPTTPVVAGSETRGVECTPRIREVQTRRPIPMQCTSSAAEAVSGEIRYKEYGGDQWQTAPLNEKGAAFQGMIPCEATMLAGRVQVQVVLMDAAGNVVDSLGSLKNPVEFTVLTESSQPPPAFPDQPPPPRCAEPTECPPDFPGCRGGRGAKQWGDTCEQDDECRRGLVCVAARCENAKPCDVDSDCGKDGMCVAGTCEVKPDTSGPFKKNWFGLHVAQDFTPVGGEDVCSQDSQANQGYACFDANEAPVLGSSNPEVNRGLEGKVESGVAMATTRLLISYDRAFTTNLVAGARLGYAFGGGPTTADRVAFMPFHAELRGSYFLLGLEDSLRPYVSLAGGVAQVDTKIPDVQIASRACPTCPLTNVQTVTVWKKAGQTFVAGSLGAMFGFTENIGAQLNLNAMLLFPSSGFSIQPSLGLVYGL